MTDRDVPRRAQWLVVIATLVLGACDGKSKPHACPVMAKTCKRYGLTEITGGGLSENHPDGGVFENGQPYEGVRNAERIVTLGQRKVQLAYGAGPNYATVFEVETDRPTTGELEVVSATRPWGIGKLPEKIRYATGDASHLCVTLGDGYEPERGWGTALRELDGSLLFGGARTLLLAGGEVDRGAFEFDEATLRWVDADCPAFCGASWTDPGDELWRTVALQVKPRDSDKTYELLPGDHARFKLDGVPYVFVLEGAMFPSERPDDPLPEGLELCGVAGWSLYRDGLIIDIEKSGEAPTDLSTAGTPDALK